MEVRLPPWDNIHPSQQSQIPLEKHEAHYDRSTRNVYPPPTAQFTCVCMLIYLLSTFTLWRGRHLSLNLELTHLDELAGQQAPCIFLSASLVLGLHVCATELDIYMESQTQVFMIG